MGDTVRVSRSRQLRLIVLIAPAAVIGQGPRLPLPRTAVRERGRTRTTITTIIINP